MSLAEQIPYVLLVLLVALFTVSAFGVASVRHQSFATFTDLGIYEQELWTTLNGELWGASSAYSVFDLNSFRGSENWTSISWSAYHPTKNGFGIHFNPAMLLLVGPFYVFYPSALTLLFVQVLALGLAAVVLFRIAEKELSNPWWGVVFAAAFLVNPALWGIALADFHTLALGVPFFFLVYYFASQKNAPGLLASVVVAILIEEVVGFIVASIGLYFILSRRWMKAGLAVLVGGVLASFAGIQFIIPVFNQVGYYFVGYYAYLGGSIPDILITILTRPDFVLENLFTASKLEYLFQLFAGTGFLALFDPLALLNAGANLFQNLLRNNAAQQIMWGQYNSGVLPGLFIAAVLGLKNILSAFRWALTELKVTLFFNKVLGFLLAGILIASMLFATTSYSLFPLFSLLDKPALLGASFFSVSPDDVASENLLAQIPHDASVSVYDNALPHVAQRKELYMFPVNYDRVDYVVMGTGVEWYLTPEQHEFFVSKLNTSNYSLFGASNRLVVFKRNK
ncbi:MAG: DUF2079 domain-containing protein [Candidatus Micrarchaeia archaeon]